MVLVEEEEQDRQGDELVTFKQIGVCDELCAACDELGWAAPTRIQLEAIPVALKGRDVIGIAQTGSGKTGAFAIPVIQSLLGRKQKNFYNVCLALAPTRELSIQIKTVFEKLGQRIGLKVAALVGGVNMMQQAVELSKKPHIITGTPGRVKDHLEGTKGFNLRKLEFLILDEADQMLEMDFEKELTAILAAMPTERRAALFSATMTSRVDKLQKASLRDPVKVECAAKYSTVDSLLQQYIFIPYQDRPVYLHHILNAEAASSVLVFCDASHVVQRLALTLRLLGHRALPLYGKLDQAHRLAALGKFKDGKARVLVCTDVAARGLDIASVSLVINYALPMSVKQYVHRVGRTARAGASGRAINFVTQYDVMQVQKIEEYVKKEFQELALDEAKVLEATERVLEAERQAIGELKEKEREEKQMIGGKRRLDDEDARMKDGFVTTKRRRQNEKKFGFKVSQARAEHRKAKRG